MLPIPLQNRLMNQMDFSLERHAVETRYGSSVESTTIGQHPVSETVTYRWKLRKHEITEWLNAWRASNWNGYYWIESRTEGLMVFRIAGSATYPESNYSGEATIALERIA